MSLQKIIDSLHPLERKVLPSLKNFKELSEITKASGMKEIEVVRALQWLSNKGVLKVTSHEQQLVLLDKIGKEYKKKLPERIVLEHVKDHSQSVSALVKAGIHQAELNSLIGVLKQQRLTTIAKDGNSVLFTITPEGKKFLSKRLPQEKFFDKTFPIDKKTLDKEELRVLKGLQRRKHAVIIETCKTKTIELTSTGKKLLTQKLDDTSIGALTKIMLKTGSWSKNTFRRYDVEINVPSIHGGKRHFVNQATDYAKRLWIEMGFKEVTGNHLVQSLWNFDALYTPQDHPVREMHDTFFVKNPQNGKMPLSLTKKVRAVHETGKGTTSKGWGGSWSEKEAMKNVLRTHTTSLSARRLSELTDKDIPTKFFTIGKNYRNEAVNWCHLAEFNQTDGIVVDPNATFVGMLGYLRQFFNKMGYPRIQFRPAHYPYTEPSIGIYAFHPHKKKWVGMGGAGMFRPEVVVPLLGKDIPVLAWGPGFDRIMLEYYKIKDIRDLYKNDIQQLRDMKAWML